LKQLKSVLINLFLLILGLWLLYISLHKQDFSALWLQIQKVDYKWAVIVFLISMFNQYIRAMRWRLLILPFQPTIKIHPLFWALMFGYFVNMLIPRLGEVSRCAVLRRHYELPFAPTLGTVVTERVIDVLCLGMVILGVLFFQYALLWGFIDENIWIPLQSLWGKRQTIFWGLMAVGILALWLFWLYRKLLLKSKMLQKPLGFLEKLWQGIISFYHIPQKGLFLFHTFLIWFTYFLMTYLWFFALPATTHLGWDAGWALLAIGSLARLVPTQGGGIGAYQLLTTQGFLLFGIAEVYGGALAIVIHSTQIVFSLLLGGIGAVFFWVKKKRPLSL
jgi:glycosyltransferase 2 family protein